jgi:hypothetical protein
MRYNARIIGAIIGVILVALCTVSVALSLPLEASTVSRTYEPMTLSQWYNQRSLDVLEDSASWDCRINGNAKCGVWQYELICGPGHIDCTLEGVDLRTLRD